MEPLIAFLDGLTFWHWWGLAGVLLVLELLTGTTYLLWPVVAAALVGVIDLTPWRPSWQIQIAVFAVLTAVLTLFGDKLVTKRWRRLVSDKPHLNERAAQLRGQRVTAVAPFAAGHGRVRLGDTVWAAVLEAPADVDEGASLEIVAVDGATLKVRTL
jgi:membrane protein implicated in regulation of membrane protease activity